MAWSAITHRSARAKAADPGWYRLKSGRRDLNPRHPRWQRGALPLSYSRMPQQDHEIAPDPIRACSGPSSIRNQNQYSAATRDFKPSFAKRQDRRSEPSPLSICVPPRERIALVTMAFHRSLIISSAESKHQRAIYDELCTSGRARPKHLHNPQVERRCHQPRTPRRLCHPDQVGTG